MSVRGQRMLNDTSCWYLTTTQSSLNDHTLTVASLSSVEPSTKVCLQWTPCPRDEVHSEIESTAAERKYHPPPAELILRYFQKLKSYEPIQAESQYEYYQASSVAG